MRKLLTVVALAVVGWQGYGAYQRSSLAAEEPMSESSEDLPVLTGTNSDSDSEFTCDGRTYCSEMTSCEEATWFIEHCPDTKMDGDGDGEPCESQWCGR